MFKGAYYIYNTLAALDDLIGCEKGLFVYLIHSVIQQMTIHN